MLVYVLKIKQYKNIRMEEVTSKPLTKGLFLFNKGKDVLFPVKMRIRVLSY